MVIANRVWICWVACATLIGCGGPAVELDTQAHQALLERDRVHAEQATGTETISLTLEEALERGVRTNLDGRVAALEILTQQRNVTVEQLKALPSLSASGGYTGRSNDGATSSKSVLSGQQSLEPSQSTDRDRTTGALEANWNLLDLALAYTDAKKADAELQVAQERHAKVIENIERDVYAAYWRAYAYQSTKVQTEALLGESAGQIDRINQAVDGRLLSADTAGDQAALLNDRLRTLQDLNERFNLSEIELKSMLALPLKAQLALQPPGGRAQDYKGLLGENLEAQEWEALKHRPELREEIIQKNITLRDTKREILSTFPGLELFGSTNYDSNSFLSDATWSESSIKLVENLIGLVTLPARYHAAKSKEALADARREALTAAVLAQTDIARQRLSSHEVTYQASTRSMKAVQGKVMIATRKQAAGLGSGQAALQARLDAQIEAMRAQLAQADLQDAYAAYMNTLGRRFFQPVQLAAMAGGAG